MTRKIPTAAPSRLRFYLPAITLLLGAALLTLWSAAGTGAYLTDEGDWQGKAGVYRMGVIDYTVAADNVLILDQTTGGAVSDMVVPLKGGVQFYDSTVDAALRSKEFNEGATVLRLRVVNRSDSMVEIGATMALSTEQTTGNAPFGSTDYPPALRILPLPGALTQAGLKAYNYRGYVLSTLKLPDHGGDAAEGLAAMNAAFLSPDCPDTVEGGVIRGATGVRPAGTEGVDYVADGSRYYYCKDIFFLLWSEYGAGLHNAETVPEGGAAQTPAARLSLTMTVGQLE